MGVLQDIAAELERGSDQEVRALTQTALDEAIPATEILEGGLMAGMQVVGERFRAHEIFLPHVLLAARAMGALRPRDTPRHPATGPRHKPR